LIIPRPRTAACGSSPDLTSLDENFRTLTSNADDIVLKQELSDGELPATEPVDVILEPGMVSIHHPFVLHGAEPNTSGARRGGLAYRYMPTTSHFDQELEIQQGVQGKAFNANRQLHLVRGIDVCGLNNIYRPAA